MVCRWWRWYVCSPGFYLVSRDGPDIENAQQVSTEWMNRWVNEWINNKTGGELGWRWNWGGERTELLVEVQITPTFVEGTFQLSFPRSHPETKIWGQVVWDVHPCSIYSHMCIEYHWEDTEEIGTSDSSGMEIGNERKGKRGERETYIFFLP